MSFRRASRSLLAVALLLGSVFYAASNRIEATERPVVSGPYAGGGTQNLPGSPGAGGLLNKSSAANAPIRPMTHCRD